MKTLVRIIVSLLVASITALAVAPARAQSQTAPEFSQQELEQMLAPIALHPDVLLSQILMAATYPMEVVEAARWSGGRPGLSGDDAVRAAGMEDWDPSVISLVAFPHVLSRMSGNLQWTQALGDAFLYQQTQVMVAVQDLRRRAQGAGSLIPDERWRVLDNGSGLVIEPQHPEVVYVPWYDPLVVYGTWWWPAYPPVQWRPWPVYNARPGYVTRVYWAPPVRVSPGFFFGAIDWNRRQVQVVRIADFNYRHGVAVNRAPIANREPGTWHHEARHREDLRPIVRPEIRPDDRFAGRRPDARLVEGPRTNILSAGTAQSTYIMKPASNATRFDHHLQPHAGVRVAAPAPVVQPAATTQHLLVPHGNRLRERPEVDRHHESPQAEKPIKRIHAGFVATQQDFGAKPMERPRASR